MSKLNLKNTYWNDKGKYQKQYDELFPLLVPDEGMAATYHGEVLRCIANVYYDVYNNGGGNFAGLRVARTKIVSFLSRQSEHIPHWLHGSYACTCDTFGEFCRYEPFCECVTDLHLTQKIVNELENVTNICLEFVMNAMEG